MAIHINHQAVLHILLLIMFHQAIVSHRKPVSTNIQSRHQVKLITNHHQSLRQHCQAAQHHSQVEQPVHHHSQEYQQSQAIQPPEHHHHR